MLGIDPLYVANEGKFVAVVAADQAQAGLDALRSHPLGADAAEVAGDAGDAVVVLVEDRHDDDFVDDIPHVDGACEIGDVPGDPGSLGFDDLGVG